MNHLPAQSWGIETTERDRSGRLKYVANRTASNAAFHFDESMEPAFFGARFALQEKDAQSGQVPILGLAGEGEEHAVYRFLQGVSIVEHKQSGSPPNPRVPVARLAKRLAHCHAAVPEIAALAEHLPDKFKGETGLPRPSATHEKPSGNGRLTIEPFTQLVEVPLAAHKWDGAIFRLENPEVGGTHIVWSMRRPLSGHIPGDG